ncbi:hypothetical protein D3C86_1722900 [compost metagenome]
MVIIGKRHFVDFHIVDRRAYLVHAVGRRENDHTVLPGCTGSACEQVDRLIASVPEENTVGAHLLDRAQFLLDFGLVRIRVAVIVLVRYRTVRVFVRIQEYAYMPGIFVSCG